MKTYYEDLIREMKGKALQHVELQKRIRKESEERLVRELKSSEDMLEGLRDSTAELVRISSRPFYFLLSMLSVPIYA